MVTNLTISKNLLHLISSAPLFSVFRTYGTKPLGKPVLGKMGGEVADVSGTPINGWVTRGGTP